MQRLALLPGKGAILSCERISPLDPQENARGVPLDPDIAGLQLEELHALRSVGAVYVASPRVPANRYQYQPRPYYREARVTMAQRQTLCGAALLRSPPDGGKKTTASAVVFFYGNLTVLLLESCDASLDHLLQFTVFGASLVFSDISELFQQHRIGAQGVTTF